MTLRAAKMLKNAGIGFLFRWAVGFILAGGFAQFDQRLGHLDGAHHTVKDWYFEFLLQIIRKLRKPGAAE